MAKLLRVEPKTGENIEFPRELSRQLETTIKLTNTSSTNTLAFKMKVNSPKTYLVRPSGGVLCPNEHIVVQIILQPQQEKVQSGHHRFLIHSAVVPAGTTGLGRDEWPRLAKEKQLEEQLLNVVFREDSRAPAQESEPVKTTAPSPDVAPDDIKAKFDELKGYALSLERELNNLQTKKNEASRTAGSSGGGYSMLHILVAVIVSLLVMKIPGLM